MKRKHTTHIQRSDTHAAALRATDSAVRGILNRLMQTAPAPLDCGGLLSFCVGVASSFDIACGLLKQPKPEFLTLHAESKALAAACIARFEAAGQTDADGAADPYKRSHPAWAALVEARDPNRKDAATQDARRLRTSCAAPVPGGKTSTATSATRCSAKNKTYRCPKALKPTGHAAWRPIRHLPDP